MDVALDCLGGDHGRGLQRHTEQNERSAAEQQVRVRSSTNTFSGQR